MNQNPTLTKVQNHLQIGTIGIKHLNPRSHRSKKIMFGTLFPDPQDEKMLAVDGFAKLNEMLKEKSKGIKLITLLKGSLKLKDLITMKFMLQSCDLTLYGYSWRYLHAKTGNQDSLTSKPPFYMVS